MLIDLWFVDRSSRGSVDKGTGLSKWFRFCIWCQMEKKPAVFPALKRPFCHLKKKKKQEIGFLPAEAKLVSFYGFLTESMNKVHLKPNIITYLTKCIITGNFWNIYKIRV